MRRVLLLACLFALLGLATVAYADCTSCLTSVFTNRHGTEIDLNFVATSADPSALPNAATAVVMQVDGQRTKCQNITLAKVRNTDGAVMYAGTFSAYGLYSHSGRVDLGGQIYEFTVPLDGKAGTIALAADQTPLGGRSIAVQVNAAPVTPHPVAVYFADTAPAAVADTAPAGPQLPEIDRTFAIAAGLILITIVGAFIDRRRFPCGGERNARCEGYDRCQANHSHDGPHCLNFENERMHGVASASQMHRPSSG